jgi:hypothetical protein
VRKLDTTLLVRPIEFRKPHIIEDKKSRGHTVDRERREMFAARVMSKILVRAEALVIPLDNLAFGGDHILAVVWLVATEQSVRASQDHPHLIIVRNLLNPFRLFNDRIPVKPISRFVHSP